MRAWRSIGASLVAVAAGILLSAASCRQGARVCAECRRDECRNLTFTATLRDGGKVETCCARCGLHYIAANKPSVDRLEVRDFDTAGLLDATKAFFVEGSDVSPCTAKRSSPTDERGCCMKTLYDRCLPSLLAFGTRQAAEDFTQRHGGKVKTLAEIERVR